MTDSLPSYPVTEETSGLQDPETSLRSGTEVSLLAALLVLAGWLALLGTFVLGPFRELSPEQDIEPGEAFGLGVFLLLPFYAMSLVVVPALLLALFGWLPRLITGFVSPVLALFGWWTNHAENASLHRVLPTLDTVAMLATCAGGVAWVLVVVEAVHRATPAERRSRAAASRGAGAQPTQPPRPPQPPKSP